MRCIILSCLCLVLLTGSAVASPEIPGAPQKRPIALVGGTVHPVHEPPLEQATIVFAEGRITALGTDVEVPEEAEQIDIAGKHVYPGLFDAYTDLGLIEINSVRATVDVQEVGPLNPNVRANVAVNPDSELIPVTRSNGVLLALTAPQGGLITGRSAVLQLDGWTYEEMTLRGDIGLHVEWPRMQPVSDWTVEDSARDQIKARDEALESLEEFFVQAKAYQTARQANGDRQPIDARFEAMLPVLERKLPLVVAADEAQQIQAAVAFAQRHNVRLVIYGGYDAPYCAELLRKYDVPVIVAGVYRLPSRRSDDYDAPYTLPERLRAAGLRFCISGSGRFGASNVRNLPYHAATAAAYGLPLDEALKSITLYPAEILGVADRVGTLEVGKDATLIVTTGNPLETSTQVEQAYIQGRQVDLSDRHKRLYEKYQEKYRRQAE